MRLSIKAESSGRSAVPSQFCSGSLRYRQKLRTAVHITEAA